MRSAITAAVVVAVVTLAGCSSYDSVTQRIAQSITPYRITVVQGNFVSQEKASQLQAGMTREQVRAHGSRSTSSESVTLPCPVNLIAFDSRLLTTCASRPGSPRMGWSTAARNWPTRAMRMR